MSKSDKKGLYDKAHEALSEVIVHSENALADTLEGISQKVDEQAEHVWIADHVDMEPMEHITKTWDSMEVALHNKDIRHLATLLGELRMHTDDFEKKLPRLRDLEAKNSRNQTHNQHRKE